MALLDGTTAARLERLEAITGNLIKALWALHTDSTGRSSGALSSEAMTLIKNAAEAAGVDLTP